MLAIPTFTLRGEATPSPTAAPILQTTPNSRSDLIAGIIILVVGLICLSLWTHRVGYPWWKSVRAARAVRKNAMTDWEVILGTSRVTAHEVEPPQEFQRISPRPISQAPPTHLQPIQETATPESKRSQTTTLVNSTNSHNPNDDPSPSSFNKSDSSNDSFSSARSQSDSEPFPEFDPEYHPSNDLADFSLVGLQSSVRDSQVSDSTMGTTIEVGEAREVRMTVHSPTLHSSRCGSNV
jgi:hypothetical protein